MRGGARRRGRREGGRGGVEGGGRMSTWRFACAPFGSWSKGSGGRAGSQGPRDSESLAGAWTAEVEAGAACGYLGVWVIDEDDSGVTCSEQPGSGCCGFMPNCILKIHRMEKVAEGRWEGTLCMKPVVLERRGPGELVHRTTDGVLRMTRRG